jgi:excisionase family DNA binding protein
MTAATATPQRAVYTIKEVAVLLALSLNSTYALVRTGRIPAVKLGNRWMVPRQRFHAWLNEPAEQAEQVEVAAG